MSRRAVSGCKHNTPTHLGGLVGQQGVLGGLLAVGAGLELGQVAVVVALHLQVEDFGLAGGRGGDEVLVQQLQDALADVAQLLLHLLVRGVGVGEAMSVGGREWAECVSVCKHFTSPTPCPPQPTASLGPVLMAASASQLTAGAVVVRREAGPDSLSTGGSTHTGLTQPSPSLPTPPLTMLR